VKKGRAYLFWSVFRKNINSRKQEKKREEKEKEKKRKEKKEKEINRTLNDFRKKIIKLDTRRNAR
jgi:uncharacterized membrane protein YcgQ (UPF0703/DUF1980 family)